VIFFCIDSCHGYLIIAFGGISLTCLALQFSPEVL
jgi:hypothetical protein